MGRIPRRSGELGFLRSSTVEYFKAFIARHARVKKHSETWVHLIYD